MAGWLIRTLVSLANCILFVTFALFFRSFDLSLKDTKDTDIEWDDCFAARTRGHLKVSLRGLDTDLGSRLRI